MLIHTIFYNNPDYYPPMQRGAVLLDARGIDQVILCNKFLSDLFPDGETIYPPRTRVLRLGKTTGQSWKSFLEYLFEVLKHTKYPADIYIGYDLYGFVIARLLSWRFRRPLVYHIHDFTQLRDPISIFARVAKCAEVLLARTADLIIVPDAERARQIGVELSLTKPPLIAAGMILL